ncbi:MAG: DUF2953 domain-containing protein [Lachnospiraceae bacterium]|nr:DUF2953 domain-containing protein [Lachnospiraceae bacterium]
MTILKIIGIILLVIIGILLLLILAVLFVPVRYKIDGVKDTEGDILNVQVKAHWLLYILYARASYEGKKFSYVGRLFGFPVKKSEDASDAEKERKKRKKKIGGRVKDKAREEKEEKERGKEYKEEIEEDIKQGEDKEREDKGREDKGREDKGREDKENRENVRLKDIEYKIETYEDIIKEETEGNWEDTGENATEEDKEDVTGGQEEETEERVEKEGENRTGSAKKAEAEGEKMSGEEDGAEDNEGPREKTGEGSRLEINEDEKGDREREEDGEKDEDEDNEDDEEERKSFIEKLIEYLKKVCDLLINIKEKLASAFNRIKHLKDEICFHYEFLTDEKNQEQFENLFRELHRVLKHSKPGKFSAKLCIGTEDPADTGMILAVLSLIYPLFNGKFEVTPCFDRSIIDFDLKCRGRIMVFVVLYAGFKVYFHKGFRKMLRRYKNRNRRNKNG